MYPFYFYLCGLASTGTIIVLVLLAIFPIKLPIVAKTIKQPQPVVRPRKVRAPTRHPPTTNYWDPPWADDDEDL